MFGTQILSDANRLVVREIIKMQLHPLADVAVGFLFGKTFAERREQTVNTMLALTSKMPNEGERIVTYSFPNDSL